MDVTYLLGPGSGRAGEFIQHELRPHHWTRFTAVVAFARLSGVKYIEQPLRAFAARGARADLTIGSDMMGTTFEAAWYLMNAVRPTGRVLLASAEPNATFHPKLFVFSDADASDPSTTRALRAASKATVLIGSSNLTRGGLYTNDEASMVCSLDLSQAQDLAAWTALLGAVEPWTRATDPCVVGTATPSRLKSMALAGVLPQELILAGTRTAGRTSPHVTRKPRRRPSPPTPPTLAGPPPPPLHPPPTSPPGLAVLIARLVFGGSRRWPQWELNKDVLSNFFGITRAGDTVDCEAVTQIGLRLPFRPTQLVIGTNRNRRLEFPEPDGRPDPSPAPCLLVVVDRRPHPFRYAILMPGDAEYAAVEALNRTGVPVGQHVAATRRVVVQYGTLGAVWPGCAL